MSVADHDNYLDVTLPGGDAYHVPFLATARDAVGDGGRTSAPLVHEALALRARSEEALASIVADLQRTATDALMGGPQETAGQIRALPETRRVLDDELRRPLPATHPGFPDVETLGGSPAGAPVLAALPTAVPTEDFIADALANWIATGGDDLSDVIEVTEDHVRILGGVVEVTEDMINVMLCPFPVVGGDDVLDVEDAHHVEHVTIAAPAERINLLDVDSTTGTIRIIEFPGQGYVIVVVAPTLANDQQGVDDDDDVPPATQVIRAIWLTDCL